MTKIFKNEDNILKKASTVIIYYWLCRTYGVDAGSSIRPFLEQFNQQRLASKRRGFRIKSATQIREFDRLDQNTNNADSMIQRYEILENLYLEYSGG